MATQNKGPSKTRTAANALTFAAAVAGGIVAVNIIFYNFSALRVDLTKDKIYQLSKVSRDTVKELPDRMHVKAFISSGLQPPLNAYAQYTRDLLDEYAAASGGKIQWESIDPTAPGKDADETRKQREEYKTKYKIRPITLEKLSESKLEIGSDNFLAVAVVFGEEIESIPQIIRTDGLEFELTSLIKKLVKKKKRKLGFTAGQGELSPQQGLQLVSRGAQDWETTTVNLDKPVPDDVDVLMVVGPRQPFNEKAKWYLDQYLMKGKPLGLFVDGMVIESPQGMNLPGMEQPKIGRANDTGLEPLLDKWGLKIKDNLILDQQNVMGPVPVEGQLYLANYPTFIGVDEKGLTKGIGLTEKLNALIVPFASSVELLGDVKDGKVEGLKATPIARTTKDHSWRQSGFFVFNPQVKLQKTAETGPFVLGYALEGKVRSAYPSGPPAGEAGTAVKEAPHFTRLLVFGNSRLFNDQDLPIQYVPVYGVNRLFFVNAVDWLGGDDSMIALRSKGMANRPLVIPPESNAKLLQYLCELGLPAMAIAMGLVLWYLRAARRRAVRLP